ncbi:MAG: hypothetical protein HYY86_03355 [Candidatus Harrisonbacteria bacterium]|nr:hypothetical protein [Candidatus Harrisonbacteria bacterium]
MRRGAQFLIFLLAASGLFLFFNTKNTVTLSISQLAQTVGGTVFNKNPNNDIEPQKPLSNPPEIIKAIYATGWSAGSEKMLNYLIKFIKDTELNAVVIDIKDYSGELSYLTEIEEAEKYGKERALKILRPNALIKKLHDEGIYVIARQTIFQDPVLAKARPDLALTSSTTGKQWRDNKKVMWVDPAGKEVWDYNVAIAKDALARGFDEINIDYIRFPTDGNTDDIKYPFWDSKTLKRYVIRDFFKYFRQSLPDARLSADLFGLTTVNYGDVGIGQNIEDAYNYFNAVAPMVYPSHYNKGFNGHQNPAAYPHDVVYISILEANKRLEQYKIKAEISTSTEKYLVKNPALRPWLQDFDLGMDYDAEKVRAQITAVYNAATGTPMGWMLWDPSNNYTKTALLSD